MATLTRLEHWAYSWGYQADDEGYEFRGYYWRDDRGNTYDTLEQALYRAVEDALK